QDRVAGDDEGPGGLVDVAEVSKRPGSSHAFGDDAGDALLDADHSGPLPLEKLGMLRDERLALLEERFVAPGEDAEHEGEDVADEVIGRARAEFVELVVARKTLVQPDDRVFLRRVVVEEGAWRDVHATADLGDGRAIRPSFERELDGSAMDGVPRLPLFAG